MARDVNQDDIYTKTSRVRIFQKLLYKTVFRDSFHDCFWGDDECYTFSIFLGDDRKVMAYLSGACHLNHSTQLTVDEHKKREGFAMQRSQLQVDFLNHRVLILIAFHSNSKTENQFFSSYLVRKQLYCATCGFYSMRAWHTCPCCCFLLYSFFLTFL